jgi:hypothetical protein
MLVCRFFYCIFVPYLYRALFDWKVRLIHSYNILLVFNQSKKRYGSKQIENTESVRALRKAV